MENTSGQQQDQQQRKKQQVMGIQREGKAVLLVLVDLLRLLHLYKLLGVVLVGILIRAVAAQRHLLIVYVAGSHLEGHKADTADIVFRPGVGVFLC